MNQIIIHGRLADDVQVRDYKNSKGKTGKMATFSVAVDPRFGDNTNFFDCASFGDKQADLIATHFHKGQEIMLTGEMTSRVVEKDGKKTKYWTVNVDRFDFCGKREDIPAGNSMENVNEDVPF